jgi:hypothetical protein
VVWYLVSALTNERLVHVFPLQLKWGRAAHRADACEFSGKISTRLRSWADQTHRGERAEKKAAHMALIWVQFFLTFPDDFAGHLRQKKNFKDNSTVTVLMFGPVVYSTLGPA